MAGGPYLSQCRSEGKQLCVPVSPQQRGRENAVRRQHCPQQKDGPPWKDFGRQHGKGLDPPESGGGENAPDYGELRADTPLDMSPHEAVIPELHPQEFVIEEVDQKFHPCADGPAQDHERDESQVFRGQSQQGGHGQPVNGT